MNHPRPRLLLAPTRNFLPFNPFSLDDEDAYRRWRDAKLTAQPRDIGNLIVEIRDPRKPRRIEIEALLRHCATSNLAIWSGLGDAGRDKLVIRALGHQLGLERLDHNPYADDDAITSLRVKPAVMRQGYIPYSNRPLAWHTDGYYNRADKQIGAVLLHCVQPAAHGGENQVLDHEILYLLLRDENPDYLRALMHPRAMTIPPNLADGKELRPARPGPVFSLRNGHLHMRYTDRERSIEWRDDPLTREAVAALKARLKTPSPWHYRIRLEAGQGLICNNVLHTRTRFEDGEPPRLLYRARYFDRIAAPPVSA